MEKSGKISSFTKLQNINKPTFLSCAMEKDIGKIKKSENTDIIVRIDDFGGRRGLTIREYTTSERYTGFTKSGTRIPAASFAEFKELINKIDEKDLEAEKVEEKKTSENKEEKGQKAKRTRKAKESKQETLEADEEKKDEEEDEEDEF